MMKRRRKRKRRRPLTKKDRKNLATKGIEQLEKEQQITNVNEDVSK